MSFLARHRFAAAVAGSILSMAVAAQAIAGPMMVTPSQDLGVKSQVTEVRSVHRRAVRGGGNGAAAAAVMGLFALGIGAAIANSQRETYYESYPHPAYGYSYGPAYAAPPAYYYGDGYGYHRNDGNYWQRKAREERDRQ
jgi:hypothetical protein